MKKILIIKHGSLGDVILSIYPIFSIKKHYQKSNITILTESKYYDLLKFIPFVDNIKFDNRPKLINLFVMIKLCVWFYREKFDWVFDLQTSSRTNIYFFIFSIFSNFKWNGIAKKCSHPHLSDNRKTLHTIERHRQQLKIAGIKSIKIIDWGFLKSDISKLNLGDNLFLIVIGGSIHRPEKRWATENYIQLIKYLNEKNVCPVIIGGIAEKKYLTNQNFTKVKFTNLVGKTNYLDLAEIAKKSKYIVGNDTGPMHLLVQCSKEDTKKVVLFGSDSNPKLCAPVGKNVFIIQKNLINDILLDDVIKVLD
ncbi:MAG: hypothetical protein CFH34_00291 [Alphaproteobacteria bacterium MarineAlpha9_Bin4]|nr:hypothetical protein [Pelagibacterales bacterium]PPR27351.1 MAG: hypothetical protein CFH34_00291 [Alphaproteobacteria bacterium MarineAlpha9_Bin4]|tara:strand:+ start:56 stop:979 length:924 start_codon:yes stop_codon:yes gene_type:complete